MDKTFLYQEQLCVRAFAFLPDAASDSSAIEAAIAWAKTNQLDTVLIDGKDWTIERAIEVSSNTTVIVDGVKLKLADQVLDNIFRTNGMVINPDDPYGFPFEIRKTENIRILGENGASMEGPDVLLKMYHPNMKEIQETVGDYWGWRGFLVFFSRCSGFELSGFTIQKTRSYAISVERSKNGYLHDLNIFSTCKNGDGINLRIGCSEIRIENITAKTSDDCIALNTFFMLGPKDYPFEEYVYPLIPSNYLIAQGEPVEDRHTHDIHIRNVVSATDDYSQAVTFLTRHGNKIYRVWVDNVKDGNPVMQRPKRLDMVGAYYSSDDGYGDCARGDLADIWINRVESNSAGTALLFRDYVENLQISDVTQNCPECPALICLDQPMDVDGLHAVSGKDVVSAEGWHFDPSNYC